MKPVARLFGMFLLMASSIAPPTNAQAPVPVTAGPNSFLTFDTYRLWPGRAEGAAGDGADETPTLTVVAPQDDKSVGAAVVVAPGGAYRGLAAILEGRQVADWFAARGIKAFVLKYRVGPRPRLPVPLQDGARAVRFVRANSAFFHIDPKRIGMIGFSAGGHLSAMTAAQADDGKPQAIDPVERVASRPDFLILGYPWLEGTRIDPKTKTSQYCMFARTNCDPKAFERFMPTDFVTGAMPRTFIYHTSDDDLVPPEGSIRFYEALRAKGVSAELHIFETGRHGSGLGGSDPALERWPELMSAWLRAHHLFERRQLGPAG